MKPNVLNLMAVGLALCSMLTTQLLVAGDRDSMVPVLPEPEERQIWQWKPLQVSEELPDFEKSIELRDASSLTAKLATPIVLTKTGSGSGVVISPDGWIITNYHVVMGRVQRAAIEGISPATVELIFCEAGNGRVRRKPGTRVATVFRVDPVKDLALLKLQDVEEGEELPYVSLSTDLPEGRSKCIAIGSPGRGVPWSVRNGGIAAIRDYPYGLTVVIRDPAQAAEFLADRTRVEIIVTDCAITGGDSGGPLLDEYGDLIGINFAMSADHTQAYHISSVEIQTFLNEFPAEPEPVPFDVWIAGFSQGFPKAPYLATLGRNLQVLKYTHFAFTEEGETLVAEVAFFDCQGRNDMTPAGPDSVLGLIPQGVWGMAGDGKFQFDVCMVRRLDGVLVIGYAGDDGIVDLLKVDTDADGGAEVVWSFKEGAWGFERGSDSDFTIDETRICPDVEGILGGLLQSK